MTNVLRMTAAVAALALSATPALAAPVGPAAGSRNATAQARIVKPLSLYHVDDLSLGTILLTGTGWTGAVVGITSGGAFSCTNVNLTCDGATTSRVARYRVTGTNNQRVFITAPNFTLANANGGPGLPFTVDDGLGYVDLSNSGNVGVEFALGGSITVNADTPDGLYTGTFNVTVDY
jgi:hypothetical protein